MESNILSNTFPVTIGTDPTSNESVNIDLAKCGNILIGGATKQGNSHCIHNLISQLNALPTPPEMILFDPKRCEFGRYKEKYRVIESQFDTEAFLLSIINDYILDDGISSPASSHSPFVLIIDELYDLICMHKSRSMKKYSHYLCYLAIIIILSQGPKKNVYTIFSTQSSDKDILTKKILENCRTRIALKTMTCQDSKRIIKKSGAEILPDSGDAILYQNGHYRRIRCH